MTCRCASNAYQHAVCSDFIPGDSEYHRGLCISCFHDEICHRPMTEAEIRADERRKVIAQVKELLK